MCILGGSRAGSSVWVAATQGKDLDWVPGSQLRPNPGMAIAGMCAGIQQKENICQSDSQEIKKKKD